MQTFCSLPGCDGERHAKGRCGKHYQRWRRRQPPGTLADVRLRCVAVMQRSAPVQGARGSRRGGAPLLCLQIIPQS